MFTGSPIPRPEYPRPDRQRGTIEGVDWLNLNGPRQFRFDPKRRGVDEQWFSPAGPTWRQQIIVPYCWESLAAWGEAHAAGNDNYYSTQVFLNPVEVTRENHRYAPRYEVGWYRRTIEIPTTRAWRDKRVILTIGAADFFTDIWCNGVHLLHHEGGYVPIECDLTDALENSPSGQRGVLVIRVEDPMDNHEQPVGKQWGWYTTTSGIWQTVFLEPRSPAYIDHFRILPDIDTGRARFEVFCEGTSSDATLTVAIIPPEAPPQILTLSGDGRTMTCDAEIYPVSLWDTMDPKLYRVVFRLEGDSLPTDEVRGYFGMRKISTTTPPPDAKEPAMLSLNNKPIYLRGALYQSYHPDGVYTATNAATLRNDIAYAKKVGFDFLRIHIKLDDPLVLYYADLEGMLLMQDFPNFGEGGDTPVGRRRFEEMMHAAFRRDFNHPSIIAWCIFNETWGFGGQTELMKFIAPNLSKKEAAKVAEKMLNTSSFQWVHEMWKLAKTIDPRRLIEDMSVVVWEHLAAYGHVDTDINSWHFYIDDYQKAKKHIAEVVAKTYRGSNFNYVEGYQQSVAPLINSEYGGVGALDGDRDVSWTFKFLTNELRRHGSLSAYIYTELTDVEWEYNGFLNYDRTPKEFGYDPMIVNKGDVLPIDAAPISRVAPGGEISVDVFSSHFSRRHSHDVTLLWYYYGMDTTGTEHPNLTRGRAKIAFPHHRVELARTIKLALPNEPMLCTLGVAAVTREGETIARNFIQHFVCGDAPPAREDRGRTLILRRRVWEWTISEWSDASTSREEAESAGSAYGEGSGFLEWEFQDEALARLRDARRLRVLCEVSAHRPDVSQTDSHRFPTDFELTLNGLAIHRASLPDHPHDTRGALSYLRQARGAYGYLLRVSVEDELLQQVVESVERFGTLRLRCAVPADAAAIGGLTVYDFDCGRYPVGPTLVIGWDQA